MFNIDEDLKVTTWSFNWNPRDERNVIARMMRIIFITNAGHYLAYYDTIGGSPETGINSQSTRHWTHSDKTAISVANTIFERSGRHKRVIGGQQYNPTNDRCFLAKHLGLITGWSKVNHRTTLSVHAEVSMFKVPRNACRREPAQISETQYALHSAVA